MGGKRYFLTLGQRIACQPGGLFRMLRLAASDLPTWAWVAVQRGYFQQRDANRIAIDRELEGGAL